IDTGEHGNRLQALREGNCQILELARIDQSVIAIVDRHEFALPVVAYDHALQGATLALLCHKADLGIGLAELGHERARLRGPPQHMQAGARRSHCALPMWCRSSSSEPAQTSRSSLQHRCEARVRQWQVSLFLSCRVPPTAPIHRARHKKDK